MVSGEPAVLDRNPLAGERLCEEIREPRATNLPARLLGAAEVLDKAVDALDGVGAFRLQRCESRDLEPCAVAEEIARERRPVVAVLARVNGEAVCLADLPVKRQHGLPAGALAAKAADRNALAGIQVFRADLLVDAVGLCLEVERIARIPHGEDRDLLAVVELLDAAVAAAEADGRKVAPRDGLLDRHLAVHPLGVGRGVPHVDRTRRRGMIAGHGADRRAECKKGNCQFRLLHSPLSFSLAALY